MENFVFKVLCRVLYSYLYEEETLSIPHSEILQLDKILSDAYAQDSSLKDILSNDRDLKYLIERFEFFKKKIDTESTNANTYPTICS